MIVHTSLVLLSKEGEVKPDYSQLSLNLHLFKIDTHLRRIPCVGPRRYSVILL